MHLSSGTLKGAKRGGGQLFSKSLIAWRKRTRKEVEEEAEEKLQVDKWASLLTFKAAALALASPQN